MSLRLVARKEFDDALRTKAFWAVSAVFAFLVVGSAVLYTTHSYNSGTTADAILDSTSTASALVPLVGLAVGYRAIASERESGTLKLLLGLPHTRREVMVGKLLGRSAVVALSLVASFAVAGAVLASRHPEIALGTYALFVCSTVALGVAFVAVGVGLSGAARSHRRAAALALGTFAVVQLLWGAVVNIVAYVKTGSASIAFPLPAWAHFVRRLSPIRAYEALVNVSLTNAPLRLASGGDPPAYLSPWVSLLVIAVWAAVPLAVGYRRFERADLD